MSRNLVLARKENERVFVGDNIIVSVVEIKGGKVRLAFLAPEEIAVDREEVRQSKNRDRAA